MTDIVEKLREGKFVGGKWVMQEAADEIERLREDNTKLSEAFSKTREELSRVKADNEWQQALIEELRKDSIYSELAQKAVVYEEMPSMFAKKGKGK